MTSSLVWHKPSLLLIYHLIILRHSTNQKCEDKYCILQLPISGVKITFSMKKKTPDPTYQSIREKTIRKKHGGRWYIALSGTELPQLLVFFLYNDMMEWMSNTGKSSVQYQYWGIWATNKRYSSVVLIYALLHKYFLFFLDLFQRLERNLHETVCKQIQINWLHKDSRIFVYKSSPLSTLPLVIPEYIWIVW